MTVLSSHETRLVEGAGIPGIENGHDEVRLGPRQLLLVCGLVLASATQLRLIAGLSPGEVLLLGYLAIRLVDWARGGSQSVLGERSFVVVWTVWVVFGSFGLLWSDVTGSGLAQGAVGETLKLSVVGLLVATVVQFEAGDGRRFALVLRKTIEGLAFAFAALLVIAQFLRQVGPVSFWLDGGSRFTGWANNPNQVAVAMIGVPFLAPALVTEPWRKRFMTIGAIGVLWASGSDGAVLALVVGFLGMTTSYLYATARRGFSAVQAFAVLAILAVAPLAVGSAVNAAKARVDSAVGDGGGGGNGRVELWNSAAHLIAGSPLVGYGPGPRVVAKDGTPGHEAHNVYLDVAILGGVPAAAALVFVHGKALLIARRQGVAMVGVACALVTFGLTGFAIRQPMYWLYLIACISARSSPSLDSYEYGK